MQMIFYPGNTDQPCRAEYGISISRDQSIESANIVVINSRRAGLGSSLWNTQEGRDIVLNKILANELKGVRTRFVRFFVLVEAEAPIWMTGIELPIRLDFNDYIKKGNPYEVQRVAAPGLIGRLRYLVGCGQKKFSFLGQHVLGGCADFYTDFEQRRQLPREEITALCAAVGYQRARKEYPAWLANCLTVGPYPVE